MLVEESLEEWSPAKWGNVVRMHPFNISTQHTCTFMAFPETGVTAGELRGVGVLGDFYRKYDQL